jgi:hypothetical protein
LAEIGRRLRGISVSAISQNRKRLEACPPFARDLSSVGKRAGIETQSIVQV